MLRVSLIGVLLFPLVLFAQDNSARVSVLSGGHVEFNFRNLNHYTSGITLTNSTQIGLSIADIASANTLASWSFTMNAVTAQLDGSSGATMNLNQIRVTATNVLGLGAATFAGATTLTGAAQTLVSSNLPALLSMNWSTHQIGLTYECGTVSSLLSIDQVPDYYTVDIEFTLEPGF